MFYHMIIHLTYLFTHYNRSHQAYFNSQIHNIDHKIEFEKHSIFLLGGTFEKITKQESILVGCVSPHQPPDVKIGRRGPQVNKFPVLAIICH